VGHGQTPLSIIRCPTAAVRGRETAGCGAVRGTDQRVNANVCAVLERGLDMVSVIDSRNETKIGYRGHVLLGYAGVPRCSLQHTSDVERWISGRGPSGLATLQRIVVRLRTPTIPEFPAQRVLRATREIPASRDSTFRPESRRECPPERCSTRFRRRPLSERP